MRLLFGLFIFAVTLTSSWTAVGAQRGQPGGSTLSLWRLDCGSVVIPDADFLNDAFAFDGITKRVVVSCYLIRDGDRYMLWDAGLSLSRLGKGGTSVGGGRAVLTKTLLAQIHELGIDPKRVGIIALSHYHSDHSGQAATLPWAKLMIGAEDMAVIRNSTPAFNLDRGEFSPWTKAGAEVDEVIGDHDIFGDKRVIMLATPGHTPGHHSLLLRLASGTIILTGDLWHFRKQIALEGVPKVNVNRADTLASMDRIEKIAHVLKARIIIGHEPGDVQKLPRFPLAAH